MSKDGISKVCPTQRNRAITAMKADMSVEFKEKYKGLVAGTPCLLVFLRGAVAGTFRIS